MPAPAFAYACDEHRLEGMVPIEERLVDPTAKCARCGQPYRGVEGEEWNAVFEEGRVVGLICPDCQTPEENAEAVINEPTLHCSADEKGQVYGAAKEEEEGHHD
jgi:hypothetical protein